MWPVPTRPDAVRRPVPPGTGYVDFACPELLLQPSTYDVTTAMVDKGHTYDYADRAFELRVRGRGDEEPGSGADVGRVGTPCPRRRRAPLRSHQSGGLIDAQQ